MNSSYTIPVRINTKKIFVILAFTAIFYVSAFGKCATRKEVADALHDYQMKTAKLIAASIAAGFANITTMGAAIGAGAGLALLFGDMQDAEQKYNDLKSLPPCCETNN